MTKIDCSRCRKMVDPLKDVGNMYCPDCARWLTSVYDYEREIEDAREPL